MVCPEQEIDEFDCFQLASFPALLCRIQLSRLLSRHPLMQRNTNRKLCSHIGTQQFKSLASKVNSASFNRIKTDIKCTLPWEWIDCPGFYTSPWRRGSRQRLRRSCMAHRPPYRETPAPSRCPLRTRCLSRPMGRLRIRRSRSNRWRP